MRSRLLISVTHLPTIWESQEEMLPGGLRQESPTSPRLDDYVRSICQLAQPTSVLDKPVAKDRLRRPHWPAWASEESFPTRSLYDITTHSSTQQPTLPESGTADPLDWLFGMSRGWGGEQVGGTHQEGLALLLTLGVYVDRWAAGRPRESSEGGYVMPGALTGETIKGLAPGLLGFRAT